MCGVGSHRDGADSLNGLSSSLPTSPKPRVDCPHSPPPPLFFCFDVSHITQQYVVTPLMRSHLIFRRCCIAPPLSSGAASVVPSTRRFAEAEGGASTSDSRSGRHVASHIVVSQLTTAARHIRNLHQYRHARNKSMVNDLKFSRQWYLARGEGWEIKHEQGHELEAETNFAVYRYDSRLQSSATAPLSGPPIGKVGDIVDPLARYHSLLQRMRARWRVGRGASMDKLRMSLAAAEALVDFCRAEHHTVRTLPQEHVDAIVDAFDATMGFATHLAGSHTSAVAAMIRIASLADEVELTAARDGALRVAKHAALRLEAKHAFAQPNREPSRTMAEPAPLIRGGAYGWKDPFTQDAGRGQDRSVRRWLHPWSRGYNLASPMRHPAYTAELPHQ